MASVKKIAAQDFSRLHLFQVRNRKMCLDVNSARVIRLSGEAWRVLQALDAAAGCGHLPEEAAGDSFSEEAVAEIEERMEARSLFTDPIPYDPRLHPLPKVESAILNLTHICNLGCSYCFMEFPEVREHYGGSKSRMSMETAQAAVDFLHARSRRGATITFFGGEPLLEIELLKNTVIYGEAKYKGWFHWNVITNGTRLNEDARRFLDEYDVSVIVSLDGARQSHDKLRPYKGGKGSYDDIMGNLQHMQGREAGLKINVTFADPTADLLGAYDELRSQGLDAMRFEKAAMPSGSLLSLSPRKVDGVREALEEMAARYLEGLERGEQLRIDNFQDVVYRTNAGEPRRRGCDTGVGYLAIAADGTVYPCHKFIGNPRFAIGSVNGEFDASFGQAIWNRPVETRNVCSTCWARNHCGGYCVADNDMRAGDFFTPDPVTCDLIRATIERGIWVHEELRERAPAALVRLLGWKYLTPDETPERNPDAAVVSREPLVLELWDSRHELNWLASEVWELCDGARSVDQIVAEVQTSCPGAGGGMVDDDVRDLLTKLVGKGLVRTQASAVAMSERDGGRPVLHQIASAPAPS